jgi:hypothetical protein
LSVRLVHVCMCAYIHVCVYAYVRVCVCARMLCVCVCVCVPEPRVDKLSCVYVCIRACEYKCMYVCTYNLHASDVCSCIFLSLVLHKLSTVEQFLNTHRKALYL